MEGLAVHFEVGLSVEALAVHFELDLHSAVVLTVQSGVVQTEQSEVGLAVRLAEAPIVQSEMGLAVHFEAAVQFERMDRLWERFYHFPSSSINENDVKLIRRKKKMRMMLHDKFSLNRRGGLGIGTG